MMPYMCMFCFIALMLTDDISCKEGVRGDQKACRCDPNVVRKGRVVGGMDAEPHEFPFVASLRLNGTHLCGGTLVSRRAVLTAGHCIMPAKLMAVMTAHLGTHATADVGVVRQVSTWYRHNTFQVEKHRVLGDIAVLILQSEAPLDDHVVPACLPQNEGEKYEPWLMALVIGWGLLASSGLMPSKLQKARIRIYPHGGKCFASPDQADTVICAGMEGGGFDSCQGDSGGPLVMVNHTTFKREVVGVVSGGVGCALPNYIAVYTKVSAYLGWIKQILADHDDVLCDYVQSD